MYNKPLVAIVGSPNVGKSTLINRFKGKREAIVHNLPGVTRDRHYIECEWGKHKFIAIDTGGFLENDTDPLASSIKKQILLALEESDIILFVVDSKLGKNGIDDSILNLLKKQDKTVLLVVNKIDSPEQEFLLGEFYSLGFNEVYPISALHGIGIGELLDGIFSKISVNEEAINEEEEVINLAIIGKPNVGKSSLINAILGEERVIVNDKAGTTRDAIDSEYYYNSVKFNLIDTAGIRKKSKIEEDIEFYAVNRAIKSIKRANVVGIVIDSNEGVSNQDLKIINLAINEGKAIFIIANKEDLLGKEKENKKKQIHEVLSLYNYIPVIYTSTKLKKNIHNIFPLAIMCLNENNKRISTGILNKAMQEIVALNPPPSIGGRHLKIYYCTQAQICPPKIILFVNDINLVKKTYLRYVEQKLREYFGFSGTPIELICKVE